MIRSFKIEELTRNAGILNNKLNDELSSLQRNGWKIINITSFESKI